MMVNIDTISLPRNKSHAPFVKRLRVFTALKIQIEIFWVVTPRRIVDLAVSIFRVMVQAAWFL
jgi:hypothetical protein